MGCGSSGIRIGGFVKQSLIDWEASWAESTGALLTGIVIAAVVAGIVLFWMRRNASLKEAE